MTRCDSSLQHILCQSSVRADLSRQRWHHVSFTYTENTDNNYSHTDAMVIVALVLVAVVVVVVVSVVVVVVVVVCSYLHTPRRPLTLVTPM